MEEEIVMNGLMLVMEQLIREVQEELEVMDFAMGHLGAILMGIFEDDLHPDEADVIGNNWVFVNIDVDDFRAMGDPCFKLHFRLSRATFEVLLRAVAEHLVGEGRIQRVRNPLDLALLMVLWILANPDTFRSTAVKFGVTPGVVHFHYCYIIEALREMAPLYVQWPDAHERAEMKRRFQEYSGFPGIVGCLDGSHCVITAPLRQKARYRNYQHTYSMKINVVCDDRLLVRDMHVGEVGSMHDARVFRRSPLFRRMLLEEENLFELDEHIVGDTAYPLTDKLMVPFKNRRNLNPFQRRFNRTLSRCRMRVEHTFGKIFGQWRRIKKLHSLNIELAVDHIVSCLVLNNFMILNGEVLMDWNDIHEDVEEDENEDVDDPQEEDVDADDVPLNLRQALVQAKLAGIEKRLEIMFGLE